MTTRKARLNVDEKRERSRNRHRNVAVVGLWNQDDKLLMIRTARLPHLWQPIGGGVEPGDQTPTEAAIRELKEEAALDLSETDLTPVIIADYDFGNGVVHFFQARID